MLDAKTKSEFQATAVKLMAEKKTILLVVATLLFGLGIAAMITPSYFLGSILVLVGGFLIASGFVKAIQFGLGITRNGFSLKGLHIIAFQIGIDITLGLFLINNNWFSVNVFGSILGGLFILEGAVQVLSAFDVKRFRTKVALFLTGGLTAYLGGMIAFRVFDDITFWIGYLVGIKLLLFSMVIYTLTLAGRANENLNDRATPKEIEKIRGAVYAGYFGGAFHVGIYIGDNRVIHYRDDNKVTNVTWERFRKGREVMRWDYPDVARAPVDTIISTAKSQVGKDQDYNFFRNNCEHFVIYCISGGKTRVSKYAQNTSAKDIISAHPFIGNIIEFHTRIAEWVLFKFGGVLGKKLSLKIRKTSSLLTARLLAKK